MLFLHGQGSFNEGAIGILLAMSPECKLNSQLSLPVAS
jgi:hypothetical protein